MKEHIKEKLAQIAKKENVYFLLAVESGSRAWGFPSENSDYDVRAIFIRPQEEYLQIFDSCENISFIENQWFDISCWDMRKALRLLLKSNMTLFEWLQSSTIYQEDTLFKVEMLTLGQEYFQPSAALRHYQSIAKNILMKIDFSNDVKVKRWLYLLRSLLAAHWVGQGKGIPPITLQDLMVNLSPSILEQINEIVALKAKKSEISTQKLPIELVQLTKKLWQQVSQHSASAPQQFSSPNMLNQCFQQTLARFSK